MKKNLCKRIVLLVAIFVGALSGTQAQTFDVDTTLTATQMVQNLVGPGVVISNVQVTANPRSYGYYTSLNSEIGTSQGLLLTTGRAQRAKGPNNSSGLPLLGPGGQCLNCGQFNNQFPGSDLLDAAQDRNTFDACMIEFDIIPQGDSIKFAYTFASEEYLEWVGSPFNDVFGFYISGPNIGTDVNLATLPVSGQSVAINNVNNVSNPGFFQNNITPPGQLVQYDGFTRFLVARAGGLIPCETYHLKLIIADGSDRLYDSGVMIQRIESNPIVVITTTAGGVDYMVEGCNEGTITFSRTFASPDAQDVVYWVGGTATNGTDYTQIGTGVPLEPTTITIPANQLSVDVPIEAFLDGVPEGEEYLTIYLANPLCSNQEALDSVNFFIRDFVEAEVSANPSSICSGQCTTLTGIAETSGDAVFFWTPTTAMTGENTLTPTVCPTETTTYTLRSEVASCISEASITIAVSTIDINLTGTELRCTSGNTGSIDLDILNALAPFEITWTGPNGYTSSLEDINNLAAGQYCVTVRDAAGCVITECITLEVVDPLRVDGFVFSDFSCFPISCNGASDGSIDVTVGGGQAPYNFAWSNTASGFTSSSQNINNLPAGTYDLLITDDAGCELTTSYTLEEPEILTIQVVGSIDLLCNGTETGEATVAAQGGCSPYFFSWSHDPILTAPVATNLGNGVYTASVTDVNGCASNGSVTITINDPIDPLQVTIDEVLVYPGGFNISCPDAEDGSISITVSSGTLPYTIEWFQASNPTPFATTEDLTGAPCGEYTLVVTDGNGCEFTENFELTCVPAITINTTIVPNPCNQPEAGLGAISLVSVAGGHGGAYTLDWTGPNGFTSSSDVLTGLNSGLYTLVVTDALGCTETFTRNVGTNDAFTASSTVNDVTCGGTCDGQILLDITPIGVYSFAWTGPNGSLPATEDQVNLCAGDYTLTITSASCEETYNFTILEPLPIDIDVENVVNPVCFGNNNGSIDISATGGTGVLTFTWLPVADPLAQFAGANTEDIFSLFEACYTVEVRDQANCLVTETICLDAPQVMTIFPSASSYHGGLFNISCFGENDGALSVSVSGGTPDCTTFAPECYNYDWSSCADITPNDPNTSNLTGLGAGVYCVSVTDVNNCLATLTIALQEPPEITDNSSVTNCSCFGANDGTITPNLQGGSGFYTSYNWTEGNIGANAPDAPTLTNLTPGCYTLVVTDSYGCEQTFSWCITEPTQLSLSIDNVTQVTCPNSNDGALSFSFSGGTPDYDVLVTGPNGPYTSNNLTGLEAGTYVITVTDASGCSQTQTVEITSIEEFTVSIEALVINPDSPFTLSCFGDANATLQATVVGGNGNVTLEWTDELGNVIGTNLTLSDLGAGTYCILATDENGCEVDACFEVTQPAEPLTVTSSILAYPNGFNVSCFGECDGEIDITVTGGVGPYTYLWDLGEGDLLTDEDQVDLCAGDAEVLVTDANGCDVLTQFELTEPTLIGVIPVVTNVTCNGACDGEVSLNISGGIPGYTVNWTNPVLPSGDTQTDLCPGTYEFEIIDATGCSIISEVTITEPEVLEATLDAEFVCETGLVLLCPEVTGGTFPYNFAWSNGAATSCISVNEPGNYCLTVVDANGCEFFVCFDVTIPALIDYDTEVVTTSCGLNNGEINITINSGTPPYTFFWTGPDIQQGLEDQQDLGPGNYDVIITDGSGCTSFESFIIEQELPIVVQTTSADLTCFDNSTGSASISVANASEPIEYLWTWSSGTIANVTTLTDLDAGQYTVNWTDSEGCSGQEVIVISEPDALVIDITLSLYDDGFNISEYEGNDGAIDTEVSGGTTPYTYDWDNDAFDGQADLAELTAGQYLLTVTDLNGCSIDTLITLTEPSELALPTGITPNGDGFNDFYVIQGISGFPNNEFQVFNRWGNLVYDKTNYDNDWRGQSNGGEDLPNGTYFIVFTAGAEEFNTYVDLRR